MRWPAAGKAISSHGMLQFWVGSAAGVEGLAPFQVQRSPQGKVGLPMQAWEFPEGLSSLVRSCKGRPPSWNMCPGHHGHIILMNLEYEALSHGRKGFGGLEQAIPLLARRLWLARLSPGSWSSPPSHVHGNFHVPLLYARLCAGGRHRAGGAVAARDGHKVRGLPVYSLPWSPRPDRNVECGAGVLGCWLKWWEKAGDLTGGTWRGECLSA